MATPIVYKGETTYIQGETENNATAYSNIQVVVYDRQKNILIAAAMATASGYDTSIFRVSDDKEFEVLIKDTVTASAQPGMYIAEVKLSETDSDWATAVAYTEQEKLIFEIRDAVI
jgi:hypothetical protein